MLSYRLKVSSPYSPENALIPTKSENLKEPPPFEFPGRGPARTTRVLPRAKRRPGAPDRD
jgi:hypothetical protein